jgi:hypothetical protein
MSLSGDIGVGPWFGTLLAANAVFLVALLALVVREHGGKVRAIFGDLVCTRCWCACGRRCLQRGRTPESTPLAPSASFSRSGAAE